LAADRGLGGVPEAVLVHISPAARDKL